MECLEPHPRDGWLPTVTLGPLTDSHPPEAIAAEPDVNPDIPRAAIRARRATVCYDCGQPSPEAMCGSCRRYICNPCWVARYGRRAGCGLPGELPPPH